MTGRKVTVTLVRSPIGEKPKTRGTLRALGLRRLNATREHVESLVLEGMLRRVAHLVRVDPIGGAVDLDLGLPEGEMSTDEEGNLMGNFKTKQSVAAADVSISEVVGPSAQRTAVRWDTGYGRTWVDKSADRGRLRGHRDTPSVERIIRYDGDGISVSIEPMLNVSPHGHTVLVYARPDRLNTAAEIAVSLGRPDIAERLHRRATLSLKKSTR